MKINEIDDETVLLELLPTQYYQLWNKWDLYEHLQAGKNKMTFQIEDFPMKKTELEEFANKLKQNKQNGKN